METDNDNDNEIALAMDWGGQTEGECRATSPFHFLRQFWRLPRAALPQKRATKLLSSNEKTLILAPLHCQRGFIIIIIIRFHSKSSPRSLRAQTARRQSGCSGNKNHYCRCRIGGTAPAAQAASAASFTAVSSLCPVFKDRTAEFPHKYALEH